MVLEDGRIIERGSHEQLIAEREANTINCIQAHLNLNNKACKLINERQGEKNNPIRARKKLRNHCQYIAEVGMA